MFVKDFLSALVPNFDVENSFIDVCVFYDAIDDVYHNWNDYTIEANNEHEFDFSSIIEKFGDKKLSNFSAGFYPLENENGINWENGYIAYNLYI